MVKWIKMGLHKVEPLTSGQPISRFTLERHHSYTYGKSNPAVREAILANLPSWEDEDRALNQERKAKGLR